MAFRFGTLVVIVITGYAALIWRLYDLQLVRGEQFLARAESQYKAAVSLEAPRGVIYFTAKQGDRFPVALNKEFPSVYAVPKVVEDSKEAANMLAGILPLTVEELQVKLSKRQSSYELLGKKVSEKVAKEIEELKLKGIYTDTTLGRFYPQGSMAAHVLGFVGPAGKEEGDRGRYGVEEFYDQKLRGLAGEKKDAWFTTPEAGEEIVLTLDPVIQLETERILKDLVAQYRAQGGSIIVQEPKTGKILSMASFPTFDPNAYGVSPLENFLNPLVQKIYEPGSVLKVITMASAIDAGKITPETTYTDTGKLTLNKRTIKNFDYDTKGTHGKVSMTYVIAHSLNTGAVFAEQRLGNDAFLSYLKKFGLDQKTGISLPGELKGSLRPLLERGATDIAFATASYGQGIAVTPLELIQAVGAIANGGNLMRPYLDAGMKPEVVRRVISEEAAKATAKMMIAAVDRAEIAKINGYAIAGKTGTAFVPDFKKGGYTENVINTYVGFGPVSDPRFIILIKLDQPPDAPLAGFSVVPAFQNLAQFVLNYYGIAPDRLPNNQ
ncbi:MAG: penicillin-binding protein 2 [Candidatus Liptonbacteria bacterium]|nr:penicillin-binding protein 2 [Candidatus Liptonbacteria bacterium]